MAEKEPKWYIVSTIPGYEKKVKTSLENIVNNREDLQDRILEVYIPTEEVTEVKNGAKKIVEHKLLMNYILIRAILDDQTWYVIRNTRGVTSFPGMDSKHPFPLSDEEVAALGKGGSVPVVVDYEIGDEVVAVTGAWRDTVGKIRTINTQKQTVTVLVDLFGRETPVELGFAEVKKKK